MDFDFDLDLRRKDERLTIGEHQRQAAQRAQREILFAMAAKVARSISSRTHDKEVRLTRFDERLVKHVQQHAGWCGYAQQRWDQLGYKVSVANERLKTLRAAGFVDRHFGATPRFEAGIKSLHERMERRSTERFSYFRELQKTTAREHFSRLSEAQQSLVTTLGGFRQVTASQASQMGVSSSSLKSLHTSGVLDRHDVMMNLKPVQLYTLSQKARTGASGKDLARFGVGLDKPAVGLLRDHSKLLHDVSVVDSMLAAKDRFEKRGYSVQAVISEHQMYQSKTSANSDENARYADAYFIVRNSEGGDETVAIEFGNYSANYMRAKMAGIDADHRLIYTHDASRADEYRQAVADLPGSKIEVFVIAPPYQEVDR